MQITWTIFQSESATTSKEMSGTLSDLGYHLANVGPYPAKAACPWIKLARFGTRRSDKGSLRTNGNLVDIYGVEGDYDGEVMQPEEAIKLLERAQCRAIIYTSPSHTAEKPRWRVLAPTSRAMPPAARYALLARVNGALGGVLTGESFTLSQGYYYGEVTGREYKISCTYDDPDEGHCVDELDDLDNIAMGKPATTRDGLKREGGVTLDMFEVACESVGRLLRTGDGRRELLKTYIASRSAKRLLPAEIEGLVGIVVGKYFDPGDPPDEKDVHELVLHFANKDGKPDQPSGVVIALGETEPEQPKKEPLFRLASELLGNIKPIQWLVKGYIEQDALCMVFGPPASGKSFLAIDIAACVAAGVHWHGCNVKQGAVFYIAGEGLNGVTRRLAAWQKVNNKSLDGVPLHVSTRAVMILDRQAASELAEEVQAMSDKLGVVPRMVIVDTLARNFGPGDENKQQDASQFVEHLDEFIRRRWKCCVVIVHHTGHDADRARGSSVFKAAMDQEIGVKPGAGGLVEITVTKMKDAEIPSPRTLAIDQVGLGIKDDAGEEIFGAALKPAGDPLDYQVGKSQKTKKAIKGSDIAALIRAGWPGREVAAIQLSVSARTVSNMVDDMVAKGHLEKGPTGEPRIADEVLDAISKGGALLKVDQK